MEESSNGLLYIDLIHVLIVDGLWICPARTRLFYTSTCHLSHSLSLVLGPTGRLCLMPNSASKDFVVVYVCFVLFRCFPQNLEMPNPFFDKDEAAPGMTPAAIGYRYRKFQLG